MVATTLNMTFHQRSIHIQLQRVRVKNAVLKEIFIDTDVRKVGHTDCDVKRGTVNREVGTRAQL